MAKSNSQKTKRRKVMVLGSGPIKIGEAAEFDYSGTQALKALHEENIETIIVNSNVATVQTSYIYADHVYLLPVKKSFLERIIKKERPYGIMMGFGGQSALNAGIDLDNAGILKKYGIKILGTPIKSIKSALGRSEFKELMSANGIKTVPSLSSTNEESALEDAEKLGYPVMIRVSFNLGGRGSLIAKDHESMAKGIKRAFAQSKTREVLVEKYLNGWKEVEYEVVRDAYGNAAVIACIENLDPMGVHTGDSVAVTPAQTLDNEDYNAMRAVAIKVAESINLVGECNVQFALDPKSRDFYVIETNPRMSRSSALASKATGYPLAYVSAKLALGYRLYELMNEISKTTSAFFEPSLDYITVKIPRWDMPKFGSENSSIGTEMKSIGEVMGIGRSFEEAMQKAVRMLDIGEPGIVGGGVYNSNITKKDIISALRNKKAYWFLYAAKAFSMHMSVESVHKLTGIDAFFLGKIKDLVDVYEHRLKQKVQGSQKQMPAELRSRIQRLGFTEKQIHMKQQSFVKGIDSLAGEAPSNVNYLYTTRAASCDDAKQTSKKSSKALVLGAGVFRIGVSVEFDWSSVNFAKALKKRFDEVSILNYNPETVSTDWDVADKLYFDAIDMETVKAINEKEKFDGVVVFTGGQIGNNIAHSLSDSGLKFIGTSAKSIDSAEERGSFSKIVEKLDIKQPEWASVKSIESARHFAEQVGFPILARPSYILSGSQFRLFNDLKALEEYASKMQLRQHPILLTRFYKDSIEAEMDCVSDGKSVFGITMQHIEEAGVHSGDSTIFTPFSYSNSTYKEMQRIASSLARELSIKGPFNIQFLINNNNVYIIELNMRASRSMPFSSKSVNANLMQYAYKAIFDEFKSKKEFVEPEHKSFMVKSPQFSWLQMKDSYPVLGPEMKSTGESAAFGREFNEALLNSWLGVSPNHIPKKSALVYGSTNMEFLNNAAKALDIPAYTLEDHPVGGSERLSIKKALDLIDDGEISMIMTDNNLKEKDFEIRRKAADLNVPLVLNGRLAERLAYAFKDLSKSGMRKVSEMNEYYKKYDSIFP